MTSVSSFIGAVFFSNFSHQDQTLIPAGSPETFATYRNPENNFLCSWYTETPSKIARIDKLGEWVVFSWGSFRCIDKDSHPGLSILSDLTANVPFPRIVSTLDGEYVLVAWNHQEKRAWLAVDPLGMQKIYYLKTSQGFWFSSHPQLFRQCGYPLEIAPEGLNLYLSLRGIPAPHSIFRGISKVRPGHCLLVEHQRTTEAESFPLLSRVNDPITADLKTTGSSLLQNITSSLTHSIEENSCSAGIFLSGGLDSALLLALAQKSGIQLKAFSAGYSPTFRTDETEAAKKVASYFKVPFHSHKPDVDELLDLLTLTLPTMPEPVADPSFLPQLSLALQAEQSVDTLLDGTGADNLFGGLNKSVAESYFPYYHMIPRFIRRKIILPILIALPSSRKWRMTNTIRLMRKFAEGAELQQAERQVYWTRFLSHTLLSQILAEDWLSPIDAAGDLLRSYLDEVTIQDRDLLPTSYMSIKGVMPWGSIFKLLTIENHARISIRLPYLKTNLIEFGLRLPDHYKVQGHQVKFILRQISKELLPPFILQQRKKNFSPPLGNWLGNEFRDFFIATLKASPFFNPRKIEEILTQQLSNQRDWQLELWTIMIFQAWWNNLSQTTGTP